MNESAELKRNQLEPMRYEYLSEADSHLYDEAKKNGDIKDMEIMRLLEEKAARCKAAHSTRCLAKATATGQWFAMRLKP